MAEQINPYFTLPTIVASTIGETRQKDLLLTIIYHPEPGRIGESAVMVKRAGGSPDVLGRQSPCFGKGDEPGNPLGDRYVSRKALSYQYCRGVLVLSRSPSSSRVRVDGEELNSELRLNDAQLDAGVPILLGGRVVLLLRRLEQHPAAGHAVDEGSRMQGNSAYMRKLREQIGRLAATDLDLLIRGETGTGKELVAEAVHAASSRASAKMIAVNMAAIPVSLAPSVLFGSAKGAFSGADKATSGYFGQADGGTLFLDEVGDTAPEIQPQLLRALQQREVQSVGGPIRKMDLRVISATDVPLDEQTCNFKAALRHRLCESEISLLPLRGHPEDIGELLWLFLEKAMVSLGRTNRLPGLHSEATEIARWADVFYQFARYSWPGNIRELENYAQQVAVASEATASMPEIVAERFSQVLALCTDEATPAPSTVKEARKIVSDEDFRSGMENAGFEVARAARQLCISRQSVYRRIAEAPDLCLASELPVDKIEAALCETGGDLTAAARLLRVSRSALRAHMSHLPMALAG